MRYKSRKKRKINFLIVIGCIVVVGLCLLGYKFSFDLFFKDISAAIRNVFIPKVSVDYSMVVEGINKEIEEENLMLKEMLELDTDRFTFIHADVVGRDTMWYWSLTINKGSSDGIDSDMAVISKDSLIGKIVATTKHSSTVRLLSSNDEDMKVAVNIEANQGEVRGILDGYLASEEVIVINYIEKTSDVEIGDRVYTNGLGGVYPNGIYVGEIIEVEVDSLGLNKIAKIKSNISYDTIRFVSVVK